MRVLVGPDKFKGTLSAQEIARAIAEGWRRARPEDDVEEVPLADGGEGTLDALLAALGGERHTVIATGPLGDPVEADYGIATTPAGVTGIVEMAEASGLRLVPEDRRDPLRTTTRGTGELILGACSHRPARVIAGIGGSATNDGGAGMAQALGVLLLDSSGGELARGGAALLDLDRIDTKDLVPSVRRVAFVVASDVDNPLVGPQGASTVYGPQKGASPQDVETLDRALARYADVLERDLGLDVRDRPGAGAAGGLGAGLMAFLGAEMRPGVDIVMEAVDFRDRLGRADLVITGEGKLDRQSLRGKTVAGVLDAARELGVPAVVACGQAELEPDGATVVSLAERFGLDRALEDTAVALAEAAESLAGRAAELVGA